LRVFDSYGFALSHNDTFSCPPEFNPPDVLFDVLVSVCCSVSRPPDRALANGFPFLGEKKFKLSNLAWVVQLKTEKMRKKKPPQQI
jgi:hypothetical protein